ncbi:MAG: glutathione peroxidase [Marivibrio sp.]|uniref:glutathione peroxidase n=1 Tax=Marivibrio sp. TaxID=2039719 RepID=UPI0032EE6FA1
MPDRPPFDDATSRRAAIVWTLAAAAAAAIPLGVAPARAADGAHAFSFPGIDGRALSLADFAGAPILVVNTASFCGFTDQYEALQALYARYRDRGFAVVGVPSNDFGRQEPGTAEEIQAFCTGVYGVEFPLADKQTVRGPDAHPFYLWARDALGPENAPRWNFHKYLVGPDGALAAAFPSRVRPDAPELLQAIERLLPPAEG